MEKPFLKTGNITMITVLPTFHDLHEIWPIKIVKIKEKNYRLKENAGKQMLKCVNIMLNV